jgi:predicted Zn finger-like uncharacterized protein
MFKVVPDQLRVSEGWVRCGQCEEVFDANANLQTGIGESPASEPQRTTDIPIECSPPHARGHEVDTATAADPEEASVMEPFLEVNPHALHIDPIEVPGVAPAADAPHVPFDPSGPPQPAVGPTSTDAVQAEPVHSFMQHARPPSRWHRRWVRVALSLTCVVLGMLLFLQVVYRERDRIAVMQPDAKRLLERMCTVLACRINPVRQIESVLIDSSSFTKVRADVYRLNFTLKNAAQIAIATPAMELTLTDMQDQAIVRRVFTAGDFGSQASAMEPGAELQLTLPVAVKLSASSTRISGYRLLSFYP